MKSKQNFPFYYSGSICLIKLFTLLFAIIFIILVTVPLLKAEAEVRGDAKGKDRFSVTEMTSSLAFPRGPLTRAWWTALESRGDS